MSELEGFRGSDFVAGVTGSMAIRASELMATVAAEGRALDAMTRLEIVAADGTFRVACLHDNGNAQVIAVLPDAGAAGGLAAIILSEAADRVDEIAGMARDGGIPADVKTFSDLHDYFDANMIGCAGSDFWFQARPLIGLGAPDRDEAECGVMNCANNAVEKMISDGILPTLQASGLKP